MCKNKTLLLFALVCMVGLFAALMPFSDIDQDGLWDSLVTEGFILIPVLCSVAGAYCRLDKILAAYIAAPRLFSSPLFSPPIFN